MSPKQAANRQAQPRTSRRGRPEIIPWGAEMPFLLESRRSGTPYTELADSLTDRYGVPVSPQLVRGHVSPHLSKENVRSYIRARSEERENMDSEDAQRLASWMLDHPGATRREAAEALNFPLYRVENLMPSAREVYNGYLIPPVKEGKAQFTEEQMLAAIRRFAKETQTLKSEPLSQYVYAEWRAEQSDDEKKSLPSPVAFRRRFGTWTEACEAAGFTANPLPRSYDGLSVEDIVLWMAHWLRDIVESDRGLVDASQSEYRQWVRKNPSAPSEELLRMRGTWANLLSAASVLERTVTKLPDPKPVGTEGRLKNSMRRRRAKVQ